MSAILLSVRPVYAAGLLAGTKTAEVRRRFPDQPPGTMIYVYSSSPERAVLGTLRLDAIDRPASADVWLRYRDRIQISRPSLEEYLSDCDEAAILQVSEPTTWQVPVSLIALREVVGIEPPQSFRYLHDHHRRVLAAHQPEPHSAMLTLSS